MMPQVLFTDVDFYRTHEKKFNTSFRLVCSFLLFLQSLCVIVCHSSGSNVFKPQFSDALGCIMLSLSVLCAGVDDAQPALMVTAT